MHPPSHNLLGNNNGGNNHLMFNLMSKFESPSRFTFNLLSFANCFIIYINIIKYYNIFILIFKRLLNLCNTPDKFLNHNNNGYGNHFNNNNGFKLVNQF